LDLVFFDIGGVMYDDSVYRGALLRALRDLGARVSDEAFDEEYERCRQEQSGSFRRRLAALFLGGGVEREELSDAVQRQAARYWFYPPEALEPDVRPCLEELHGRYRLGIIANQPSIVREAMRRDRIEGFFDVWGISDDLALEKPDPRLYSHALLAARVSAERAVMVGDRLDYDVRPAKRAGMRAVWVLRGEAPVRPSRSQLVEADACVATLAELPGALERL
jgi:putative hydrolase of the HAD superfamily